jgi:hypothetical protein
MNITRFRESKLKLIFILLVVLYLPFQGFAWGVIGHRVVGEIASFHLNAKARKEIARILGTESIAMASNWADFYKSDPAYDYLYNWHFININDSLNHDQFIDRLRKDTAVDAYTKVNMIVDSLKGKKLGAEKKLLYVRLLIHIVGDLHQPMHVARLSDLGGNRVRVQWFNQPSNLHRVWDEQLVEFQQLSYTEYATSLNHASKTQRDAWQQQPLAEWVFDTYLQTQKIYMGIKEDNQKLSYRYNFDNVEILNNQLLKGGIRLAGILNQVFG